MSCRRSPRSSTTKIQALSRAYPEPETGICRLMDKILHDLICLNYGIYGTILYLGHAEFVHQQYEL